MMQLNARYRSATLVPQGRRDADYCINLGMKYDIPVSIFPYWLRLLICLIPIGVVCSDTYELKQKVEKRRNPRIFLYRRFLIHLVETRAKTYSEVRI